MWLSFHVSPNFLLLIRTPDIALRTPANSARLHLNLKSLAKTLFPNEVPFIGPGGEGFNVSFSSDVTQSPSWAQGYAAIPEWSQDANTRLLSLPSCCCSGGKQEPQEMRWRPPHLKLKVWRRRLGTPRKSVDPTTPVAAKHFILWKLSFPGTPQGTSCVSYSQSPEVDADREKASYQN